VDEAVIREQFSRCQQMKNKFTTNQTPVFPRTTSASVKPAIQDPLLPKCILVDIDGTVASMSDRSPFDWKKVHLDEPKHPVINVVKAMKTAGYAIVFLSGRDSISRADTISWLEKHIGWLEGQDYSLFMRPINDSQKDSIVKRELFDNHIQGQYYVEVVLDDRDQVVALWRNDLGLTCLQVAYGNF